MGQPLTIAVEGTTPVVAGAQPFILGGVVRLAVAVKATFVFDPSEPQAATIVRPDPIQAHDHVSISGACVSASDLALRMPTAGVVLRGSAWSIEGQPLSELRTRLVVLGDATHVDKMVYVLGDPEANGSRAPFERIPLVYARAFGGPGVPSNPVGVPRGANLVDPRDPSRPACYAPIPASWPDRARLLGAYPPGRLDDPLPSLPDDFDFRFFQSAPIDQRCTRSEAASSSCSRARPPSSPSSGEGARADGRRRRATRSRSTPTRSR